jgi:hypothetical protein
MLIAVYVIAALLFYFVAETNHPTWTMPEDPAKPSRRVLEPLETLMQLIRALAVVVLLSGRVLAQGPPNKTTSQPVTTDPWSYSITFDAYVIPHGPNYVDPVFTADRDRIHLEARYNYENLETGSLWAGYNFKVGQKLVLNATPMIGGVFGRTTGIAPGYEVSLNYKRVELSTDGEYVFDTNNRSGSFFYSWSTLTYSPIDWFRAGLVEQRTQAYRTPVGVQRGLLVGFSRKQVEFTTYIFNIAVTDPTVVLEVGVSF